MKFRNIHALLLFPSLAIALIYIFPFPENTRAKTPLAENAQVETAVFAAGCFWCVEANFEKVPGVSEVVSGYTGGHVENPTYQQVCSHATGHLEAVEVTFDANKVAYNDLLEVFWRSFDPTDSGGSFHDRGESYTSAIFVNNDKQRQLAEASKARLEASARFDKTIVTPVRELIKFYPAEDYHQNYYLTHPLKYKAYRFASGRDQFVAKVWGADKDYKVAKKSEATTKLAERRWTEEIDPAYVKPSDQEIRDRLSKLQYNVTQHESTERPFSNPFWNENRDGIYVDIVSGEPLFSSKDKFKSGTGWPSFTRPLVKQNIEERIDRSLLSVRTEVRSKHAGSHLGHVFEDGPDPTGLRYCINSAALRFVPADQLAQQGYQFFEDQFEAAPVEDRP